MCIYSPKNVRLLKLILTLRKFITSKARAVTRMDTDYYEDTFSLDTRICKRQTAYSLFS